MAEVITILIKNENKIFNSITFFLMKIEYTQSINVTIAKIVFGSFWP